MRKEILTSSLASCYIWLAGTALASVAVKSGPLITSLEAVILPVEFATVTKRAFKTEDGTSPFFPLIVAIVAENK